MTNDSYKRTPIGHARTVDERLGDLESRLARFSVPTRIGPVGAQVTDWNDAVDAGFYWGDSGASNRPTGASWLSGVVYRNEMPGFERVVQEVVTPTTVGDVGGITWRRVGFPSGGVWAWGSWALTSGTRGTTANRDLYYGVPATDAARVALANRKITWFNTELGWMESYYAVTGLSGLTARGLEAGTASGWYPISDGPWLACHPTATVTASAGSNISGWNGESNSAGGTAFIEYTGSGVITVKLPGRYRVRWTTAVQIGGGELDMWLYAGADFANDAWELNASRYKAGSYEFSNIAIAANETCRAYVNAGTCTVHVSSASRRGEFLVEYLGPRLVTA